MQCYSPEDVAYEAAITHAHAIVTIFFTDSIIKLIPIVAL